MPLFYKEFILTFNFLIFFAISVKRTYDTCHNGVLGYIINYDMSRYDNHIYTIIRMIDDDDDDGNINTSKTFIECLVDALS